MPAFVCRWPNGDFSVVQAQSKAEASILLDEVGNADGYPLFAIPQLMLNFRLTDDGRLELETVGERSFETFWNKTYPLLFTAMMKEVEDKDDSSDVDDTEEMLKELIAEAVKKERQRVPKVLRNDPADIPKAMRKRIEQQIADSERDSTE